MAAVERIVLVHGSVVGGRANWRESSIGIPEAARGGKAVLRLYYNLDVYEPVEKGTLVEEKAVPLE